MKSIINDALAIISMIEREQLPVREFLRNHAAFFADMDRHSLIPPECRNHDHYSESVYVFVIGSYLYQRIEHQPVTWFERRRFAEFKRYGELFSRTLCSNPNRRFQRICELKQYLTRMMGYENTASERNSSSSE